MTVLGRAGGKLFHVHFNDNSRLWDDDMIVGLIHIIEYVEILYWLDQSGDEGYLWLDQYPCREEPERAISESIQWLRIFRRVLRRVGPERVAGVLRTGDATEAPRILREAIAGCIMNELEE